MTEQDLRYLAHLGMDAGHALREMEEAEEQVAEFNHPIYRRELDGAKQFYAEAEAAMDKHLEKLVAELNR